MKVFSIAYDTEKQTATLSLAVESMAEAYALAAYLASVASPKSLPALNALPTALNAMPHLPIAPITVPMQAPVPASQTAPVPTAQAVAAPVNDAKPPRIRRTKAQIAADNAAAAAAGVPVKAVKAVFVKPAPAEDELLDAEDDDFADEQEEEETGYEDLEREAIVQPQITPEPPPEFASFKNMRDVIQWFLTRNMDAEAIFQHFKAWKGKPSASFIDRLKSPTPIENEAQLHEFWKARITQAVSALKA